MGNSQTKEARSTAPLRRRSQQFSPAGTSGGSGGSPYQHGGRFRGSGPDLSILGIGSSHSRDRDIAALEHRRETKQEREARRLERERTARIKERERSMKEEHVDGGYLVTQGVYVGTEDFSKTVVRQLMIERRMAPFWRGLNDFSDSWAEHQLMAAARGMDIPPADEIPPELEYTLPKPVETKQPADPANIQHLTVPITARSQSYNSDVSQSSTHAQSPVASGTSTSPLFRTRAKTLAALTTSSRHSSQTDLTPRELQLPKDPFVNGQPIEVYLYKDASECPICFLYYPPYLNRTRCCDQPICSECFVQIKRPDPHPPEHADSNAPPPAEGEEQPESVEGQLVSEPSACPFCVQPEFGVTYAPPPFRRGLTYAADPNTRPSPHITSPVSSTSSLSSANIVSPIPGRRRATSLSATDPSVVTTDRVRPDWAQKLANARAHAARRSAAATALHTAAYLMNSNGSGGDSRGFSLARRGMRRATADESPGGRTGSPALNALAFLTERAERAAPARGAGPPEPETGEDESENLAPPRAGSRRTRIDDLEEMMMMEAIRLSLASEEERRRREEKDIRKEAKRREKEAKKANKVARKTGLYSQSVSTSALDIPGMGSGKMASSTSSIDRGDASAAGKGKAVDRVPPAAEDSNQSAPANGAIPAEPSSSSQATEQSTAPEGSRPSHLRHVSTSSSISSVMETTPEDRTGCPSSADGGSNPSLEPMFNFRSLAAIIGDEEKGDESAEHVEDTSPNPQAEGSSSSAEPSVHQPSAETTETAMSEPAAPVVEPPIDVQGAHGLLPKELESRSVEITDAPQNPEAPSC
ncbi:hypothetical protein N7474_002861 [Penicillium riverlandense]|uniref:uncharacterized protein n=1 Tax=Penicillium riverlandense TaxID=1903569 RepID=UPI00254841B9|nr:uncharacterized protein N7474_002861 [Penicillium riverlandense]KAJ5825723.1 hypothetical protein N7474_002861 [Penicillium riverlandense]